MEQTVFPASPDSLLKKLRMLFRADSPDPREVLRVDSEYQKIYNEKASEDARKLLRAYAPDSEGLWGELDWDEALLKEICNLEEAGLLTGQDRNDSESWVSDDDEWPPDPATFQLRTKLEKEGGVSSMATNEQIIKLAKVGLIYILKRQQMVKQASLQKEATNKKLLVGLAKALGLK